MTQETLSIVDMIDAQSAAIPTAIAAIHNGESLTYEALNHRANLIADHLRAKNVKPEQIVAILGERNLDFWTAVLGIFKTNSVYLPLNPYHPINSHAQVLERSKVRIIIVGRAFINTLSQTINFLTVNSKPEVLVLEDLFNTFPIDKKNPIAVYSANNLACVLFTSGSTGIPKGAMIEHKGMINHIQAKLNDLSITSNDIVAQNGPQSFDVSMWQFFGPLIVGAQVHIFGDDITSNPLELIKQISSTNITIFEVVPSQLRAILNEIEFQQINIDLSSLRWLVPTGETLPPDLCRQWFRLYPNIPMLNTYGTTECSDDVAHYPIYSSPSSNVTNIPIGKAIPNMQLYILDESLSELPVGTIGELYIGGIGVGRGYLNDSDRTSKAFIPNPFLLGSRLYRTGDFACYLNDGNVEFHGRLDQQIKLHGIRIEPGEIQAALAKHPQIRDSVVITWADHQNEKYLIAYLVLSGDNKPSFSDLRRFLKTDLPEYMIPIAFIYLNAIPQTGHNKIDFKALPSPEFSRREVEDNIVLPKTRTEIILISIISEVLGRDSIGINNNFFDLGGKSLDAAILCQHIKVIFNVQLPIRVIWETSNFSELAHIIDENDNGSANISIQDNTDLNAEVTLNFPIEPNLGRLSETPHVILLTGATGFFGTRLLYDLLSRTSADIYCLVRADSDEEGKNRIGSSLKAAHLWDADFTSRIVSVPGDLAKPFLGLTQEKFSDLAKICNAVYHNGALVNFIYPYILLKRINVLGTHEILRLAAYHHLKPVHYISTFSVFSSVDYAQSQLIQETDNPRNPQALHDGYAQSKWVAEQLVITARDQGLPTSIYRLGTVNGDSRTGICNKEDWFWRLIKGCLQIGKAPDIRFEIPTTTVDYASEIVVYLSQQDESLNKVFHVASSHPLHWHDIVEMLRGMGYLLNMVTIQTWVTEFTGHLHNSIGEVDPFLLDILPTADATSIHFNSQNTIDALRTKSIMPQTDMASLFKSYIFHFSEIGFLPKPTNKKSNDI